ncbi:MAG: hypothetical protein IIB38_17120, partial [Candidatus Hydrogenedentes bacterium]|nr:hypothetical protein [Candidatus Hydrogenedentota bacterium]
VDEFRADREAAKEVGDEFNRQAKRERATFMLAAIRAYIVWTETESKEEAFFAANRISIAGAGMTFAELANRMWTESDRRPENPPVFVSEIMEILEDHLRER